MRVLFVDVPYRHIARRLGAVLTAPGLLAVAAWLRRCGHHVGVVEPMCEGLDSRGIGDRAVGFAPDVIGLSASTYSIFESLALADLLRRVCPEALILLGGSHVSGVPEETLRLCPSVDLAVIGEGEVTAEELLAAHATGATREELARVDGAAAVVDGEYIHGPPRAPLPELAALPQPAWDLVPIHRNRLDLFTGTPRSMALQFSRGCLNACRFCPDGTLWQGTLRDLPAAEAVDQLRHAATVLRKTGIMVADNDFLARPRRVAEFVDALGRADLDLHLMIQARADSVLGCRDMLRDLHRLGLRSVLVGVESHRQAFLDAVDKNSSPDTTRAAAEALHGAGIALWASAMWGAPEDGPDDLAALERFCAELRPEWCMVNLLTPAPGTALFDAYTRQDILLSRDYSRYNFDAALVRQARVEPERAEEMVSRVRLRFWLDPRRRWPREHRWIRRHYVGIFAGGFGASILRTGTPRPMGRDAHFDRVWRRYRGSCMSAAGRGAELRGCEIISGPSPESRGAPLARAEEGAGPQACDR